MTIVKPGGILDSRDRSREAHLFLGVLGCIVYLALYCYVVIVQSQPFSPGGFGEGFLGILAAVAIGGYGQAKQREVEGKVPPEAPQ